MHNVWKKIMIWMLTSVILFSGGMAYVYGAEADEGEYIFNYIYIESSVIYAEDEQVIGVNIDGLTERQEYIHNIILGYTYEDQSREISYSSWQENLVLFEHVFSAPGTYLIDYIELEEEGDRIRFSMDDDDIAITGAEFNVIEDYERGYSSNADDEPIVTTEQELASDGVRFEVSNMEPVKANGKVIVVIDPGHDSVHPGASGNGLHEEELTLKIAKYCKEELETYDNIMVYMTRTDGSCLDRSSNAACLRARCNYAASVHANLLVSIHIDAPSVTATGAMAIVAKKGVWRDDLAQTTQDAGNAILKELTKVGLSSRGLYIRMSDSSGSEYVYPNGATADYYSITRNCMRAGVPGIIIEHCFITNPNDVANYLNSNQKLQTLGIADATGIAKKYNLKKKSGASSDISDALYDNSPELYEITEENIADFVALLYQNVLGRTPCHSEVSYWVNKIGKESLTGTRLVQFFIDSPEFKNKGYSDEEYVEKLYQIFLHRPSDPSGKEYWVSQLQTMSRTKLVTMFGSADEFVRVCQKYGIRQGSIDMQYVKLYPKIAEVVTNYYVGLLGRNPDAGGLEYWTKYIICGGSVSDLTKLFLSSNEFSSRDISKEDFVEGVYLTYLGRQPEEEGKAYWVSKMTDTGKDKKIEIIRGFIYSDEYCNYCEKYGIQMGTL